MAAVLSDPHVPLGTQLFPWPVGFCSGSVWEGVEVQTLYSKWTRTSALVEVLTGLFTADSQKTTGQCVLQLRLPDPLRSKIRTLSSSAQTWVQIDVMTTKNCGQLPVRWVFKLFGKAADIPLVGALQVGVATQTVNSPDSGLKEFYEVVLVVLVLHPVDRGDDEFWDDPTLWTRSETDHRPHITSQTLNPRPRSYPGLTDPEPQNQSRAHRLSPKFTEPIFSLTHHRTVLVPDIKEANTAHDPIITRRLYSDILFTKCKIRLVI